MDWKQQLRDRMSSYSEPAGDGLWEDIVSGLDGKKKRRGAAWIWTLTGAAAAAVATLLLIPRETLVEHRGRLVAEASSTIESPVMEAPVLQEDTSVENVLFAEAEPASSPVPVSIPDILRPVHIDIPETTAPVALAERRSYGPLAALSDLPSPRLSQTAATLRRKAEKVAVDQYPVFPSEWEDEPGFRPSFSLALSGLASPSASTRADAFGVGPQPMSTIRKSAALGGEYAALALRNRPTTDEEKHFLAARFGVEFDLLFAPSWSLGTGVFYSAPQSRFRAGSATNYLITRQTLGYIGVPLYLKYDFLSKGGLRLYAKAGGAGEACVFNSSTRTYYSGEKAYDGERLSGDTKSPFQWSLGAAAGAEWMLGRSLSIYAEPSFNWYIPSGSNLKSVYTEKPFSPGLSAGIRLSFGR